jgi:hypothetical protein
LSNRAPNDKQEDWRKIMNRRELLKYAALTTITATGVKGMQAQEPGGELTTVWVHGNVVQAETPEMLQTTSRAGWGTTFRGKSGKFVWFHLPLPTPTMLDNRHIEVEKIYLLFKVNGASIRNIHLYDGPRQVKAFDNLIANANVDLTGSIVPGNTWAFAPAIPVNFGLGISVGVQFSVLFDGGSSSVPFDVLFTAAGADYRTNKTLIKTGGLSTGAANSAKKIHK